MTISINQQVWHLIQGDLAIQKDLARKIINVRALAKYLIKKHNLNHSLDSVISAIRRFQGQERFEEEESSLLHIFRDAHISTKNNIAVLTLSVPASEFHKRYCRSDYSNHRTMKILTATRGVKLIIDQRELDGMKQLFAKEEITATDTDLSELSVIVNEKAAHTKGVIARLTSELALSNINIHELIVAMPEFLVYVKHKDLVKAHDSLLKLSKSG